jgi:hypothetical protein
MKLPKNIRSKNLGEWLTLAVLIFGFIYLTGDSDNGKRTVSHNNGFSNIAIENSKDSESDSRDVSGSNSRAGETCSWIIAGDAVSIFGKTNRQPDNNNSEFACQSPSLTSEFTPLSMSSLSSVSSQLALQFTLVGEMPSGTS